MSAAPWDAARVECRSDIVRLLMPLACSSLIDRGKVDSARELRARCALCRRCSGRVGPCGDRLALGRNPQQPSRQIDVNPYPKGETGMRKTSLALFAGAAILATAPAYAQSVTPTEGNPGSARPAVPPTTTVRPPATTGAAPNSAVPNQVGSPHMPGGNPDRAPASTQTHEPPAK
jgi:hypothetical protein